MFKLTDMPDLTGKNAVVTGANSGLGLQTAKAFAGAGAAVIMTARTKQKYDQAVETILPTNRSAELRFVQMDLADLSSVRAAAEAVKAAAPTLDILVNNAGIMMTPEDTTADGLELQIGTNHFGHFAFTGLLLDPLLAAKKARVVTVSSTAHHMGDMDFDDLHQQKADGYNTTAQYGRSKLANMLFTQELQRRFEAAGVNAKSVAAHPGYTATNLQTAGVGMPGGGLFHKVAGMLGKVLNPIVGMDVEDGALPQIYAAVGDVKGGSYWGPSGFKEVRGPVGPVRINPKGRDPQAAERLWQISVATTGVDYAALDNVTPGP